MLYSYVLWGSGGKGLYNYNLAKIKPIKMLPKNKMKMACFSTRIEQKGLTSPKQQYNPSRKMHRLEKEKNCA